MDERPRKEFAMLAVGIVVSISALLIVLIAVLEKKHPNRIRRNPIA